MASANPGYLRIKSTWLSRKPKREAIQLAVVLSLLVTFITQMYWFDLLGAKTWMSANAEQVFTNKEVWRAWTTLFAHADLQHLLSNVFLFFILGIYLISSFGMFMVPMNALFFGGVTNILVLKTMPVQTSLIGASGVVFWMGGVWLTLFFLIDRRRSVTHRALRSIGVAIMLFVPSEAFDPNVSYKAHLVGFLLGFLWAFPYYYLNKSKFRAAEVTEWIVDEVDEDPEDFSAGPQSSRDPYN